MTSLSFALKPARRNAAIAAGLLASAIVLGGGGTPNPGTEIVLEWLAALAAVAWLWLSPVASRPIDRRVWILAALVLSIPALQLVPLPPSVWHLLPARGPEIDALKLIGAADGWRPLSTSPLRTLASLLAMGPPLVLMAMVGALTASERQSLIGTIALMAVVAALLGAMQLAAGPSAIRLYAQSSEMVVTGFQANRNAAADVFLFGIVAVAAFGARPQASRQSWWPAAAILLLAAACVFTASRAGILLLFPALIAAAAIVMLKRSPAWKQLLPIFAAGSAALIAGAIFILPYNAALQRVADRFGFTDEVRAELWTDTLFAIHQYWPFGSGMGTFVPTFIALEPLEAVDKSAPNRAHNDYLELALEAGVFGAIVLAAVIALLAWMAIGAWRKRPADRHQIALAATTLLIVAAHSLVDYPLRSMALACLCAVMAGIFTRPPAGPGSTGETSHRSLTAPA